MGGAAWFRRSAAADPLVAGDLGAVGEHDRQDLVRVGDTGRHQQAAVLEVANGLLGGHELAAQEIGRGVARDLQHHLGLGLVEPDAVLGVEPGVLRRIELEALGRDQQRADAAREHAVARHQAHRRAAFVQVPQHAGGGALGLVLGVHAGVQGDLAGRWRLGPGQVHGLLEIVFGQRQHRLHQLLAHPLPAKGVGYVQAKQRGFVLRVFPGLKRQSDNAHQLRVNKSTKQGA